MIAVAPLAELPQGGARAFTVGDQSVLLVRSDEQVFAVENRCSHAYQPLEAGRVRGCYIFCPLHGMRFDLRTGEPSGTLTRAPLKTWPTCIVDGIVHIDLAALPSR